MCVWVCECVCVCVGGCVSGCVCGCERERESTCTLPRVNPVWTLPVLWIELFCYNYGISKQLNCILLCFSIQRLDVCNSTIIPSCSFHTYHT